MHQETSITGTKATGDGGETFPTNDPWRIHAKSQSGAHFPKPVQTSGEYYSRIRGNRNRQRSYTGETSDEESSQPEALNVLCRLIQQESRAHAERNTDQNKQWPWKKQSSPKTSTSGRNQGGQRQRWRKANSNSEKETMRAPLQANRRGAQRRDGAPGVPQKRTRKTATTAAPLQIVTCKPTAAVQPQTFEDYFETPDYNHRPRKNRRLSAEGWKHECLAAFIWGCKPKHYVYEDPRSLFQCWGAESDPFYPYRVTFKLTPPETP
uniref:ORF 4 n=1 Tax=Torque teno virus TaxID=68887 RepID=A0A4D6J0B4_9VIRU|nr:ORF 4 [Torque teno virus]